MATLPSANVTSQNSAGAYAVGSTGFIAVMSCVSQNADMVPRVFSSAQDLLSFHNYAPGVDYSAMHFAEDNLPVIFMGLPVTTAGAITYQDNSGVTGTALITPSAASSGIMDETDFVITCTGAGTIGGPTGPVLALSADGGNTTQSLRLGTLTTYTVPYLGIVLTFSTGGTLNVGDVCRFRTTAPMWQAASITTARTNLAAQLKLSRSALVVGDMTTSSQANTVCTEMDLHASANGRFMYARAQAYDRLPLAKKPQTKVAMIGAPSITFAAAGETITRATGSFVTDGFAVGQIVTVAGSTSNNGLAGVLTTVTALVLTISGGAIVNETDVASCSIVASDTITFAAAGETITRVTGSFITDGFAVGDMVTIAGSTSNNGTIGPITVLTATVLTVAAGIVNEGPKPSSTISITKSLTMAAWVAAVTPAFASITGEKRIDIAAGRARKGSPITGWNFRRPAAWAASLREYLHDVQVPCWRKDDGVLQGWDMTDGIGNVIEYDERTNGGLIAAGFTTLRTYGNGPAGAFVALSLTRDNDGALTSRTHNLAVVDVGMTTVQNSTENMIGSILQMNGDGTGTDASLSLLEQAANTDLTKALLDASLKEGPRCSGATWTASRTAILNTTGATLPGTLSMILNGTLEQITTLTRVQ